MRRRELIKYGSVVGASSFVPVTSADPGDSSVQEDERGPVLIKETENYSYYKFINRGNKFIVRVEKQSGETALKNLGRSGQVAIAEADRQIPSAEKSVSVTSVSYDIEVVEKIDSYRRSIGECTVANCDHLIKGVSLKMNKYIAGLSKGAIAATLAAAIIENGGGFLLQAIGKSGIKKGVQAAISAAGAEAFAGNSFTQALVDMDVNYILGKKKMKYGGYALGSWKPGPNQVIAFMPTIPGHIPRVFGSCN